MKPIPYGIDYAQYIALQFVGYFLIFFGLALMTSGFVGVFT
jgi:hypothetical protein